MIRTGLPKKTVCRCFSGFQLIPIPHKTEAQSLGAFDMEPQLQSAFAVVRMMTLPQDRRKPGESFSTKETDIRQIVEAGIDRAERFDGNAHVFQIGLGPFVKRVVSLAQCLGKNLIRYDAHRWTSLRKWPDQPVVFIAISNACRTNFCFSFGNACIFSNCR